MTDKQLFRDFWSPTIAGFSSVISLNCFKFYIKCFIPWFYLCFTKYPQASGYPGNDNSVVSEEGSQGMNIFITVTDQNCKQKHFKNKVKTKEDKI